MLCLSYIQLWNQLEWSVFKSKEHSYRNSEKNLATDSEGFREHLQKEILSVNTLRMRSWKKKKKMFQLGEGRRARSSRRNITFSLNHMKNSLTYIYSFQMWLEKRKLLSWLLTVGNVEFSSVLSDSQLWLHEMSVVKNHRKGRNSKKLSGSYPFS